MTVIYLYGSKECPKCGESSLCPAFGEVVAVFRCEHPPCQARFDGEMNECEIVWEEYIEWGNSEDDNDD
jgi:hypothetical protein